MTSTDAFALKSSDLNAFLFAHVGTELNGSSLTILSVLARLGKDPWAEAARWANMPKAAAVDCLAQSMGKMPLGPQALAETFTTASSLIQLLPVHARNVRQGVNEAGKAPMAREWVPMALLCLFLMFGALINLIAERPSTGTENATAPTAQTAPIRSNQDRTMAAKPSVMPAVTSGQ